ncbi:hypothetical protein B0H21DRAFT_835281 [Amylocystis lapponica]|nr:hypothetical protein B0H21DRAFT_835281 [Amylocystis lapponica]
MSGNQKHGPDSKNNAASTRNINAHTSQTPKVALLRRDLREAMSGKYVKMDPQKFLNKFVEAPIATKEPTWKKTIFNKVVGGVKEADLCESVLKAIDKANICPGHKVISTPDRADPHDDSRQKVDGGLYPEERVPVDNRNSWADQLVSFEWKREDVADDPFDDSSAEFEATSEKRQKNRGQIISYASEVLLRQHRCFHFTIVIFGVYARIIRWDRSGAIVTEKFNYKAQPRYLCRFLWRFCQLSPEKQGLDLTAVRIEEGSDEWNLMDTIAATKSDELIALEKARLEKMTKNSKTTKRRTRSKKQKETPQEEEQETPQEKQAWLDAQHADFARQCFEESLTSDWPRWRLTVCDEPAADAPGGDPPNGGASDCSSSGARPSGKTSRDFLVCKPYFKAPGVAGRGTRGYIAIDCETHELVFLKDAWRVDLDDIKREGDVLEHLASKGAQNIPTVLCHGDVRGQCTVTYKFKNIEAAHPMKKHAHYRLVEKEVGCPLSDFENGCCLLRILRDCLFAHRDAVEKANILHRDISAGNILVIYKKDSDGDVIPYGLLNDWELSKELPTPMPDSDTSQRPSARQPDRTGTWQFMSAASLNDATKQMIVQDDLESFLYVLLYFALRFLPNNHPDVPGFMREFFDGARDINGVYQCGRAKMDAMYQGTIRWVELDGTTSHLHFKDKSAKKHPLDVVILELLPWFKAYYKLTTKFNIHGVALITDPSQGFERNPWTKGKRHMNREAAQTNQTDTDVKAPTDEDAELAAKLSSHDEMCKLFDDVGSECIWPTIDKTSDQLLGSFHSEALPVVPECPEDADQANPDADSRKHQKTPEPVPDDEPSEAKVVPRRAGDMTLRPRKK